MGYDFEGSTDHVTSPKMQTCMGNTPHNAAGTAVGEVSATAVREFVGMQSSTLCQMREGWAIRLSVGSAWVCAP